MYYNYEANAPGVYPVTSSAFSQGFLNVPRHCQSYQIFPTSHLFVEVYRVIRQICAKAKGDCEPSRLMKFYSVQTKKKLQNFTLRIMCPLINDQNSVFQL